MKTTLAGRFGISFTYMWALLPMAVIAVCNARGQDYIGASAVLRQAHATNAAPTAKPKKDEQAILQEDLKAFSQEAGKLTPSAAAAKWLELVDRAEKVSKQSMREFRHGGRQLGAEEVLGALPPPPAWPELAKAIAARPAKKGGEALRESGLRMLAATLTSDTKMRAGEITNLQALAESTAGSSSFMYRQLLSQYVELALQTAEDPNALLNSLERRLAMADRRGQQQLQIPNLVSQVGPEKSEAFLRKALVAPNVTLQFGNPNQTSKLAQKLALELIDQLKAPQWGLVNSLDGIELYEALDKRFGKTTNSARAAGLPDGVDAAMAEQMSFRGGDYYGENQKTTAQLYYMLGLISRDRTADAVAVAKKFKGTGHEYYFSNAFKSMERAGFGDALEGFLHELLGQDPSLAFWDQYVEISASTGKTERMLTLVRSAVANSELSENKKSTLHGILMRALLAADKVDEGVAEVRKLIASPDRPATEYFDSRGQLGVTLGRIGYLLHNDAMVNEGVDAAKKWLASTEGQNFANGDPGGVIVSLCRLLFDCKRGPEAEAVIAQALPVAIRASSGQNSYASMRGNARTLLMALATLYHDAGRLEDVLKLLTESPDWGIDDLSEFNGEYGFDYDEGALMSGHSRMNPKPMAYLAADALLSAGQKDAAARINDTLLVTEPGLDRAYELLLKLDGTNAIRHLDELFARDQFEERPLIWKAHLLKQGSRFDDAEKTIRQAIAIDPSDGEEGRGDRMRAYAELADILQAKGNAKDANLYREVVKAIRMSEDADEFYAAGLLKRAIEMYEESLKHFSDAYCIQSRLAVQLSQLGKTQEAEEHYRRAYELMPDSFGRVESHCFGCEGAFNGEHAQSVAEKVFTKLATERPDKPQIHYLLGYLRQHQDRFNEAATNYLRAVKLDPDYLNAWNNLSELGLNVMMPAAQRDEIAFNMLRLDPLMRHHYANLTTVGDLTGLWNAVAVAAARQIPPATNIFTLTASKSERERKAAARGSESDESEIFMDFGSRRENLSPAQAVARTRYVQFAGRVIFSSAGMMMGE